MDTPNLSTLSKKAKIAFWAICTLGACALVYSTYRLTYLSIAEFVVLLTAMAVSSILSFHYFRVPKTEIVIRALDAGVIWAAIWLGVPGAVFISLGSFAPCVFRNWKDLTQSLMETSWRAFAAVVSTSILYLFLAFAAGFDRPTIAANFFSAQWLVPGILLFALIYFALVAAYELFNSRVNRQLQGHSLQTGDGVSVMNFAVALFIGIVVHLIFVGFGLSFAFVMLLIASIAHTSYQVFSRKLSESTRQISEAIRIQLATVEALATSIDARDQVGMGHVRRTQIYAVGIGEILGVSSDDLQALNTGALLHDIGKLAIPDHILNKPGRLTPSEMEKTKIHPSVGASILENVNFPFPVVPTVRHHHEMWDGSGYPSGLAGLDIPLTARILSVADAYDTLRGARPYRAAIPKDEARRYLLNGAGTQFDPKIVDVFIRNLRKFEKEVEDRGLSYERDANSLAEIRDSDSPVPKQEGYVEQIKRANREVFTLYELARVFSSSLNLNETLELFVSRVNELIPFDTCVVYLLNKDGDSATAAYTTGRNKDQLLGKRIKSGEGATGYVLKKRQPVSNINPALDFSFYKLEFMQDYTAMASLPLIAEEELVGAVSLYSCEIESYLDEHMRLLEAVSRIAADAILKAVKHADAESRALTDPMTGLPNARGLQQQFDYEIARAKRKGSEFHVLMLDLDGFKKVNDTYGHKAGDLLLKEISQIMRSQLRDYDFLSRYAGDEFVAIIPETDEPEIEELRRRIETAVRTFRLPVGEGEYARVGVSLGASCFPRSGETLDKLVIAADQAMYSVKAEHKRREEERRLAEAARALKKELDNDLDDHELTVVPDDALIVELDDSHIISNSVN